MKLRDLFSFEVLNFHRESKNLVLAVRSKNVNACKIALTKGANVNFNDGEALFSAASVGSLDIVELLLNAGANPSLMDSSALTVSLLDGRLDIAKLLLDAGANTNPEFCSAVHWCVALDKREAVDLLTEFGAIPSANGSDLANNSSPNTRNYSGPRP